MFPQTLWKDVSNKNVFKYYYRLLFDFADYSCYQQSAIVRQLLLTVIDRCVDNTCGMTRKSNVRRTSFLSQ